MSKRPKQTNNKKKAFTIVEFLLAMTFLAVLLMGIATITMRVINIYRKGLALRAINAAGRDIINDITRTVSGSPIVESINTTPSQGNKIVASDIFDAYRTYYNELTTVYNEKTVQSGGVFCTGSYSYVWNTAPSIKRAREDFNAHKDEMMLINGKYYKFARIPDTTRSACAHQDNSLNLSSNEITVSDENSIVSLISDDDSDLALYDFAIMPASQNNKTGQIFYSGTFIIATMRGGINVLSNGDFCTGTDVMYSSDVEATNQEFNYCAVNKFNFAVRATGQTDNAYQYGER